MYIYIYIYVYIYIYIYIYICIAQAAASMQTAVEGRRARYGARHRATLLSEAKLGGLLRLLGRLEEAEGPSASSAAQLAATLGAEHPTALSAAANLAALRKRQPGREAEAAATYGAAAKNAAKGLGARHPTALDLQQEALDLLLRLGRAAEAAGPARRLAKRLRKQEDLDQAVTSEVRRAANMRCARGFEALAVAVGAPGAASGLLDESAALRQEAAQAYALALGPHSHHEVSALRGLAEQFQALGRLGEAERWFLLAWDRGGGAEGLAVGSGGEGSSASRAAALASVANNLGMMLRGAGGEARAGEAETLLRTAAAGFRAAAGSRRDAGALRAEGNLADLLRSRGRIAEAIYIYIYIYNTNT